jgi:hypothetical protein
MRTNAEQSLGLTHECRVGRSRVRSSLEGPAIERSRIPISLRRRRLVPGETVPVFGGMRVAQTGFGSGSTVPEYRLRNHARQSVFHTATDDHNSTVGRFTVGPGPYTAQGAVP